MSDTLHEHDQKKSSASLDWGYNLGWLLITVIIGFLTYVGVASNPPVAATDRDPVDNPIEAGHAITATEVEIQSLDPKTNEVRWELRVPATDGGLTGATTFESPAILLYPKTHAFTITAARGRIDQAPEGTEHQAENVRLTLSGPIAGGNSDRSEWFTADSATWDGATEHLTLRGGPLTLVRGGMTVQAQELVVQYAGGGSPIYTLSGGVHITSGG